MLLELNQLKVIILDHPPKAEIEALARLGQAAKMCALVDTDEVAWWHDRLPNDSLVLAFDDSPFTDTAGNVKAALEALKAQPHECVYVSFNPLTIEEAVGTRVPTMLVSEVTGEILPDLFLNSVPELETAITDIAASKPHGYIIEQFSMRFGGGTSPASTGYVNYQQYLKGRDYLDATICNEIKVVVNGRYFPETESRHAKHQPSLRLLHAKYGDRRGKPLASAFGYALNLVVKENPEIDLITRVPPKPSKPEDHLGVFLNAAAEIADKNRGSDLRSLVRLDAVKCVKEYGQQHKAGNYAKRIANVRGVFDANRDIVRGKTVLLVDDILTSGATIVEMTRILHEAGATSIIACPVAITQRVINYDPDYELACPRAGCTGTMRIRFAKNTEGTFWGCDQWLPGNRGCNEMMSFQDGLAAVNRLATTDAIVTVGGYSF
ncbi:MAG TPA: phosphoribosyltransferase family protein [Candidatus Rubrimentiphilum sp.]|nr:phosphoribosyltransferase family protein [Candidatus Rubrimentiphilum sp.]